MRPRRLDDERPPTAAKDEAADRFSKLQLEHAERLISERDKLKRYYRQQEAAVAGIAIENIRQAKQRELLERRRTDLNVLFVREVLVPALELIGAAVLRLQEEDLRQ